MIIGTAYYPEHWTRERRETDCRLMKEMGLTAVRMGEFGWSLMEREEGRYDFSLYDETLELLEKYGIFVIFGTPTAAPPAWLCQKYPDIYMKDRSGHQRGFGSRRHYCYNHKGYQEASEQIVTALAEHYKNDARILAWQIDNELGCEDEVRCYCENCQQAFRSWLERKYGTLDRVNREWGTVFWSQTYTAWDQIRLPGQTVVDAYTGYGHNPGLLLDFARFSSDSLINYARQQRSFLRQHVKQPIIHNMVSEYCDNYRLAEQLDGVGYDAYPRSEWDFNSPGRIGFHYDLTRGYDDKKPFWVLEQQSGPCGWNVVGDTPKKGQLGLWSVQAAARGIEAMIYFRWRSCTFGAEQFWYGILDHDGTPGERYKELKNTVRFLKENERVLRLPLRKQILLVYDYENKFCHEFQPHRKEFQYKEEVVRCYEALRRLHADVDVGGLASDFSEYQMVILPFVSMIGEEQVRRLETYVQQGGILLLTPFTGQRELNNQITERVLPGVFCELSGVTVEGFSCETGSTRQVKDKKTGEKTWGHAKIWYEHLQLRGAEAAAIYEGFSDADSGEEPAVSRHSYGKGSVYYLSALYEDYELLFRRILDGEGLKYPELPPEIECIAKQDGKQLVLLNHSETACPIRLEGYWLGGQWESAVLKGFEAVIGVKQDN